MSVISILSVATGFKGGRNEVLGLYFNFGVRFNKHRKFARPFDMPV